MEFYDYDFFGRPEGIPVTEVINMRVIIVTNVVCNLHIVPYPSDFTSVQLPLARGNTLGTEKLRHIKGRAVYLKTEAKVVHQLSNSHVMVTDFR